MNIRTVVLWWCKKGIPYFFVCGGVIATVIGIKEFCHAMGGCGSIFFTTGFALISVVLFGDTTKSDNDFDKCATLVWFALILVLFGSTIIACKEEGTAQQISEQCNGK